MAACCVCETNEGEGQLHAAHTDPLCVTGGNKYLKQRHKGAEPSVFTAQVCEAAARATGVCPRLCVRGWPPAPSGVSELFCLAWPEWRLVARDDRDITAPYCSSRGYRKVSRSPFISQCVFQTNKRFLTVKVKDNRQEPFLSFNGLSAAHLV